MKALYGLHQAPRAWNMKLDKKLNMLGFIKCNADHAIYCCGGKGERLIMGVYVDDLIIIGSSLNSIDRFKKEMAAVFRMSDLGAANWQRYHLVSGELCQKNPRERGAVGMQLKSSANATKTEAKGE
jgi:hypothetical protein